MIEPEYVINFLNIITQVTATILGLTIIFWVFWYENIGKYLKLKLGIRLKGFKLIKYYNKFERTFLINFLKGKILFTDKRYGDLVRVTRLGFLYVKIKNKTKNKIFSYKYTKMNYIIVALIYLFIVVVGIGSINILDNVEILHRITKFTREQLMDDPTVLPLIDRLSNNFTLFMVIYFIFVITIFLHSLLKHKKKKSGSKRT